MDITAPRFFRSSLATFFGLIASSALLAACVAAPDDTTRLTSGNQLDLRSEHRLVEATVQLEAGDLVRGPNDFRITLHAATGDGDATTGDMGVTTSDGQPLLTSVDAVMAAHGHQASAPNIVPDAGAFHVEHLDLFMSGQWQITLGVLLDARTDTVDFALDVP